ncbi:hypothetical protein IJ579_06575 [bacterium]|nr:hypothetical protein [bacterium]
MNTTRVIEREQELYSKYVQNPIRQNEDTSAGQLIEGSFYQAKPMTVREMLTRKINKSLCGCLMVTILVTFVSYYIAMIYEAKLNNLDNEIVRINTENQDLQSELDRYRSFNNVDSRIGKFNLLQKADRVIEVTALTSSATPATTEKISTKEDFNWSVGY